MPLSGNWLVARQIVTTTLYKLVRLVFTSVQCIYWHLNGTAKKLREARLPHNYERSAQVLNVIFYHKFCLFGIKAIEDFLFTHNRFENPQYIIDNESITLLTINEHDAVFCEPKEKDMWLWRSKYGPFISHAQVHFCRRLIVVPLTTFHRLAEMIGDPKGELTFLFHVPRSGSTLVEQILLHTGRCVAVSEPNSPLIVAIKYRKFGDSPEIRQLAHDVIRWECRPYPTMQPPPLGYCLKLATITIVGLKMFRELFPSNKCLFIYRDTEKVTKSMCRALRMMPSRHLIFELGKLSIQVAKMTANSFGLNGPDFAVRVKNDLIPGVVFAVMTTSSYLDLYQRGLDIRALRYEDLVARPLDMCRVILEFCRLPVSLAEQAVTAFDVDSQRNSTFAKSVIGHFKEPEMTPEVKEQLNELLKKYGMPLIGEPGVIEGTLSYSQ